MLYVWHIPVVANRPESNPVETPLRLAHGIITWYSITFPPGCHGLAHCRIYHREHQIVPSREAQSLSGDTFPIEWTDYYEMYEPPHDLLARCWNEDDTYPHTVTIRIAVLPRKAIVAYQVADAIRNFFSLLSPKRIFTRS
ncbi:hypothetical protein ES703_45218 [subsurface metagenome]